MDLSLLIDDTITGQIRSTVGEMYGMAPNIQSMTLLIRKVYLLAYKKAVIGDLGLKDLSPDDARRHDCRQSSENAVF